MRSFAAILAIITIITAGSLILLASFSSPEEKNKNRSTSSGELSFTIRTVTANGNYSPKHVMAIWVESNDVFVKTRKAMASQRKQYLYTWAAASNFNTVDAITGPTLTSHQTHTVTWDCTDLNGDIVPDGDYVVYTEFTDKHAQGPLYSITFAKGPDPQLLSPPDETYFKDISLTFTPIVCEFSANETDICQDDEVTFTDESTNASSWAWDFGEGAVPSTANTQGPNTVTYANEGIKTVSLTINGRLTETKEDYINVAVGPTADFTYNGSDLTVEFANTSTNATSYLWDFGDGNTSTGNDPIHTYSVAGTYMVNLAATQLDCVHDTMHEVMVPMVGLEENGVVESIQIYPNPGTDAMRLRYQIHDIRYLICDLYSISGIRIERLLDEMQMPGEHEVEVDVSTLPAGVYFIRLQTGAKIIVRKLIVQ